MRLIYYFLILTVAVCQSDFAVAASGKGALRVMDSAEEWISISGRKEVAEDLRGQLKKIRDSLPSISPDEKRWLEEEERAVKNFDDSANVGRMTAFYTHPIFYRRFLIRHLDSAIGSASCVTNAIKSSDISTEMFCWATLSAVLIDTQSGVNDAIGAMRKSKYLPKAGFAYLMAENEPFEPWWMYQAFGEEILTDLIVSHLRPK
jgi:hypothetical protein